MRELERVNKEMKDLLMEHPLESVDFMDEDSAKMLYKSLITDLREIDKKIKDDLCL